MRGVKGKSGLGGAHKKGASPQLSFQIFHSQFQLHHNRQTWTTSSTRTNTTDSMSDRPSETRTRLGASTVDCPSTVPTQRPPKLTDRDEPIPRTADYCLEPPPNRALCDAPDLE